MHKPDAASVAQQIVKLQLLPAAPVEEALGEVGRAPGDPEPFLQHLERKGLLTPFQSAKLLKGDRHGYLLGGYRLLYKISTGSFGRVYRADDPKSGKVVAVKVLRRRWTSDPHRVELFEREAHVGLTLRHPNIVETLSVGRDPDSKQYYIVMEFVEGSNLRDLLAIRKKMEPAEALRLLEDAANALAYAHAQGVTHRDVKLTNVLISSQGVAKLVDFGLAGVVSGDGDGQRVDRTVDYAGLEKATGARAGDVRSDIFFLGCIAYELLTGRPPLSATKDPKLRMMRRRFNSIKPLKREEVNGPASLFQLVETMTAFNPELRYQTPAQLVEAVREVRAEAASAAPRRQYSVFVVERDERLQGAIRDKLKAQGYRVFLSAEPTRAADRYREAPYDALVVDAGTTGEDGLHVFERVTRLAEVGQAPCAAILILSAEQKDWARRVDKRPGTSVLVRPVTLKQLYQGLHDLLP